MKTIYILINYYNNIIYIIKSNNQGKEANIELIIRLMLIEIKKKVIEEIKQSYKDLIEMYLFNKSDYCLVKTKLSTNSQIPKDIESLSLLKKKMQNYLMKKMR